MKRAKAAHIFDLEPGQHYAEDEWTSRALFKFLDLPAGSRVHDPACGFGRIVASANLYGLKATGADIVPRWLYIGTPGMFELQDYLSCMHEERVDAPVIVSNPPYGGLEFKFYEMAMLMPSTKLVAFLLPLKYLCGDARIKWLRSTPLRIVCPLGPRPRVPPGSLIMQGGKLGGDQTDYAWFIWQKGYEGPTETYGLLKEES